MASKGYTEIPIEEWTDLRVKVGKLETAHKSIHSDLEFIKDKLSKNRPTWSTLVVITFLTSLSIGALTMCVH